MSEHPLHASPKVWIVTSGPLHSRSLPRGRWGRIKIADRLLMDLLEGRRWDEALGLGARVFVVEGRHEWGEHEWLCMAPEFDEIADGETAPQYDAWFKRQEDGTARFLRFERIP